MIARSCLIGVLVAALQAAQTPAADRYAPGRAIIADIGRIVTPSGVQGSFFATLGGARQARRALSVPPEPAQASAP